MSPDIWVVFSCGEIVGIYPNDESKADEVAELVGDAQKVRYRAEAACSQKVAPGQITPQSICRWCGKTLLMQWSQFFHPGSQPSPEVKS